MKWDWMRLFIGPFLKTAPMIEPLGRMLRVGDRVELTMDTILDRKGTQGTVVSKFTPSWSTGCWEVTVRFDGNYWDTSFNYPTSYIKKVNMDIKEQGGN